MPEYRSYGMIPSNAMYQKEVNFIWMCRKGTQNRGLGQFIQFNFKRFVR